ncbi:MAG: hypothetical protein QOJ34_2029 [Pseudonocardiales bacterium]|jgi:hypothetical protein|nr:hypothetical protein [Pseudonocardiales bacterium]
MAKHRARSRAKRSFTALSAAAAVTLAIGVQDASAILIIPDNKTVSPTNSDVFGKCILQVKSVDATHGYDTKIKLSGQAQPNNPNGYADNVFTQVDCYLLPAGDTDPSHALAEVHPSSNSATVLNTSTTVTLAFADSYTLCGRAFVKLVNGTTSYTPYLCA